MGEKIIIAISGYGVGHDPTKDDQYNRYLREAVPRIERLHPQMPVYLMGGATNSEGVTEAAYMREWFRHFAPGLTNPFILIEPTSETRSMQDNLRELKAQVGDSFMLELFCLGPRAWKAEVLAKRLFSRVTVHGVDFVRIDGSLAHAVGRTKWFVADVVEVLGLWFPPLNWLRVKLRKQHIERERAKFRSAVGA